MPIPTEPTSPPDPFTPWITRISGLGAGLAVLIGTLFPSLDNGGKAVAYVAACLLTAVSAFVWYRSKAKKSPDDPASKEEEKIGGAVLRGLLPFEEGDVLIGRDVSNINAQTLIKSMGFYFGVIWGQSGCGKTSFVRAKLIPTLRSSGFNVIYWANPTASLVKNIEGVIKEQSSKITVNKAISKTVVFIDQFEEFFLMNQRKKDILSLRHCMIPLSKEINLNLSVVILIRDEYFARLQDLAPEISDPTSPRTTFQLESLDIDEAENVLRRSLIEDKSSFTDGLIGRIIQDLDRNGLVRPAELQLVGTFLKNKNVRNRNEYEGLGGAEGIISSFIKTEIERLPKPIIGQISLRCLCSSNGDTKSPNPVFWEDLKTELFSKGIGGITDLELLSSCLDRFIKSRIVVRLENNSYNLVHDMFAPLIRLATEGVRTNVETANKLLVKYISEYKADNRSYIPLRHLFFIRRNAVAELKKGPTFDHLMYRSFVKSLFPIVAPLLVATLPLGAAYMVASSCWYLGMCVVCEPRQSEVASGSL